MLLIGIRYHFALATIEGETVSLDRFDPGPHSLVADLYEGDAIFDSNTVFRLVGLVLLLLPVDEIQMVDIIFRNGRCDALKTIDQSLYFGVNFLGGVLGGKRGVVGESAVGMLLP